MKKTPRNKTVKLVLAAAVCAAVFFAFFGCGRSESGSGKYSRFLTVDVYDSLANKQGIQSGWFAKIVKDKFNMELNIIAPNTTGSAETLYETRAAAGNLGDLVIIGTGNGRFRDIVESGLILDMSDYLKNSALTSKYTEAINICNKYSGKEGIYGIPCELSTQSPEVSCDGNEPMVSAYVRWDSYKAAGYPEIKTLEDFIPVMQAMQEDTPLSDSGKKTYAISLFKDWDGNMMVAAKNYASLYGYNEVGFVLSRADGSDYQDILSKDGIYVRALHFLFEANKAGLVDPESRTQNYAELSGKYRDGQILTSLWSYQGTDLYNTAENKANGKGFMPAFIEDSTPYSNGCYSEGNAKTIIAIGNSAAEPQRLADFIDWLYSPEGMEAEGECVGAVRPEGLTWEKADGKAVLTDFGKAALPSNDVNVPEEWGGGKWEEGSSGLNYKPLAIVDEDPNTEEPYLPTMWESSLAGKTTSLDTDWQDWAGGAKTTIEFLKNKNALMVAPGSTFIEPEESSDIATKRQHCKAAITEYSWKMAFANDEEEFDSLLEKLRSAAESYGYRDVLAIDFSNASLEAKLEAKVVEDYGK